MLRFGESEIEGKHYLVLVSSIFNKVKKLTLELWGSNEEVAGFENSLNQEMGR